MIYWRAIFQFAMAGILLALALGIDLRPILAAIYWPAVFLAMSVGTLLATWRRIDLRILASALLISLCLANLSDWTMTGPREIMFDTLCDFGFGVAGVAVWRKWKCWQGVAVAIIAILACSGHFAYAKIEHPTLLQNWRYNTAENWLFVASCVTLAGGSLWGALRRYGTGLAGHYRSRHSHRGGN